MANKHKYTKDLIHCPCCGSTIAGKEGTVKGLIIKCPTCSTRLRISVSETGERTVVELPNKPVKNERMKLQAE